VPYDPRAIANFFINVANSAGTPATPLKIIKLVYIAHGWHLGLTGAPLINEPPQAWRYGPVIPSLYRSLKSYGNEPVRNPLTEFTSTDPLDWVLEERDVALPNDPRTVAFLQSVWDAYGRLSAMQLSELTHQPGTPWERIWNDRGGRYSRGVEIPEEWITEHYRRLGEARGTRGARQPAAAV
jgi:uncharacterized phage-associated protein